MATFKKLPSGLWQAQVFRRGVRKSSTFASKGAAVAWAGQTEAEIMGGQLRQTPDITFSALLSRYEKDVSATKKGHRWEKLRIGLLQRDEIAKVSLRRLDAVHATQWRDRRLQAVSAASVRREWNLLSHACNIAVSEWKWLPANPFKGLRRPKDGKSRDRLPTEAELKRLKEHAEAPMEIRAFQAFLFGGETAMRAGEICGLRAIKGPVARLEDTKNGTRREVPLSAKAKAIWEEYGPFEIASGTLDKTWRGLTEKAKVENLHFHDSRHWAITRLSSKLELLELARMAGIKDLRILLVYYNKSAEDIAKKRQYVLSESAGHKKARIERAFGVRLVRPLSFGGSRPVWSALPFLIRAHARCVSSRSLQTGLALGA
jgi:integrase